MTGQKVKYYLAGSISLFTFAVFFSSLQNSFVEWDDNLYVYDNPHIRSLDAFFFRWAFSTFYAGNWHPLTWVSHALDYAAWGLNPLGHHLTSNILHAANTFLVVLLIVRLCEIGKYPSVASPQFRSNPSRQGDLPGHHYESRVTLIAAGVTGLLFGLHPLHVESVVWVSERKDLLCAFFFLLSIMSYVTYATFRTYRNYFLSLFFFVLALLSKPMAVSLPLVLLILDWYPFHRVLSLRTFLSSSVEKVPFFALSLVSSVLTLLAQKAGGSMTLTEYLPFSKRFLVATSSLIVYIGKMVLPFNLSPYYPYPRDVSLLSAEYFSALLLVIAITIISFVLIDKERLWATVWGYYVITLIPVIGIVQVGGQAIADRYVYLPSIGPFIAVGLLTVIPFKNTEPIGKRILMVRFFTTFAVVCLFVSFSCLTFKQIGIWRNSIDLWSSVIDKGLARNSLAFYKRGVAFSKIGLFDKALEDYDRTIVLEPFHYEVYVSRGEVFLRMGRLREAALDFETAVTIRPTYHQAYDKLGTIYGMSGWPDRAIESFSRSIALNPNNPAAYSNRGYAYSLKGEYGMALDDYNRAIELNQNFAHAYFSRGNLFIGTSGNKERARADMQKACELGEQGGCRALHNLSIPSTGEP